MTVDYYRAAVVYAIFKIIKLKSARKVKFVSAVINIAAEGFAFDIFAD